MAKVVKSTRDMVDINEEVKKVSSKKKTDKKEEKKETSNKKKEKKSSKKQKKEKRGLFKFLKEVKNEMAKVKWPSRKDMVKYSFATICFIIFFALFFYVIEAIMALLKAWV